MKFLINLLTGVGLGETVAGWVAWGLVATVAAGSLYGVYQWAWAAPRAEVVALKGQVGTLQGDLGTARERSAEWEAAAGACSANTAALAGRCTTDAKAADAKAREALAAAKARRAALLASGKAGPEAMNAFFQEIYQ